MKTQLSILNNQIRTLDNLYSLNDLHIASGGQANHRPSLFIRLETTKDLIDEISKEVRSTDLIFKTLRGRNIQGTWACEELVLAYAMWISPKFHLVVLRAFLNMHKQQKQVALPRLEPKYTFEFTEDELQQLAWLWFAFKRSVGICQKIYPAFRQLGAASSGTIYSQGYDYLSVLRLSNKILTRITKDFEIDQMTNWRVLKHLRTFDFNATEIDV